MSEEQGVKPQTKAEQRSFWNTEMEASDKRLDKFHKAGDKIVKLFLGDDEASFHLNLFHSNVVTVSSILYGRLPKIDVSRRYADAGDDVARVASVTLERLLNLDIENNGESFDAVFEGVMQDRLLAGLGVARVRYEFEEENDEVIDEAAPFDYYHWRDVAWGWGRTFAELPWIGFRSFLTKDEVEARFGEDIADNISMKKQIVDSDKSSADDETSSPWDRAEIWEIWDKTNKEVIWYSKGYDKILDKKADPLKLSNFFPCPPFFMANATTSLYIPKADYKISEDLYTEVQDLQQRIAIITEAVKVVGVYDQGSEAVKSIFTEGVDNTLVPVDNWAMFGEKGGLKGQIDWLPIGDIVESLDKLIGIRDDTIQLLQQTTGMSDIMQGGLKNQYEGNAQSEMKATFGSIRVQKLQEQFAKFVTGLMQIKAEIVSNLFEPVTIAQQSNMRFSTDAGLLPDAIRLIKSPNARLRVNVKAESLAMADLAQIQQENSKYMNAISTFLQSSASLIESKPEAEPFLMQLMKFGLSGYKASDEIEGVIDAAIEASEAAAKKNQGEEKPSPEQIKAQAEGAKSQAAIQLETLKGQNVLAARKSDMEADIYTAKTTHQFKLQEINADLTSKVTQERVKLESSLLTEKAQAESAIMINDAQASNEIKKDVVSAELDMEKESQKTDDEIDKIVASAEANIITENNKETADVEGIKPKEG